MRKISSIFVVMLLIGFSAFGCSSQGNNPAADQPGTEISATSGNTGDESSKPEFLTTETFKEKVWNYEKNPKEWVYEGDKPAIIDFYADWCKPCKMVAPILEDLQQQYAGQIRVYKINTEQQRELASVFQVTSIPTFLYIPAKGQPQMDRGYKDKATFERIIKEVLLKK